MNDPKEYDKIWLLTGATGQDGTLFAEMLIAKGYKFVHGTTRKNTQRNTYSACVPGMRLHQLDITDEHSVFTLIRRIRPHYIVNFAAQSYVHIPPEQEYNTFQVNTMGINHILYTIRKLNMTHSCRVFQCGTSEEFGTPALDTSGAENEYILLDETSVKNPVSMYGISKLAAEHICNRYRDVYGMFVVCGTLFNHESHLRGNLFVTKKITNYVANYHVQQKNSNIVSSPLELGNIHAKRDWGYARDVCDAIYRMITNTMCKNYVIATGVAHSVKQFAESAFKTIGVSIHWVGSGIYEKGINPDTGTVLIQINPTLYREIDAPCLVGNAQCARTELGWIPTMSFDELVQTMVHHAIDGLSRHTPT